MTWIYTPGASAKDNVRTLIPDTDEDNPIFSDEEIGVYLALEGDDVRRATAAALETMASSEAYVSKAVRISNLSTNGASVSAELRARAQALRDQATDADEREAGMFDWAEQVTNEFTLYERLVNESLRQGS